MDGDVPVLSLVEFSVGAAASFASNIFDCILVSNISKDGNSRQKKVPMYRRRTLSMARWTKRPLMIRRPLPSILPLVPNLVYVSGGM